MQQYQKRKQRHFFRSEKYDCWSDSGREPKHRTESTNWTGGSWASRLTQLKTWKTHPRGFAFRLSLAAFFHRWCRSLFMSPKKSFLINSRTSKGQRILYKVEINTVRREADVIAKELTCRFCPINIFWPFQSIGIEQCWQSVSTCTIPHVSQQPTQPPNQDNFQPVTWNASQKWTLENRTNCENLKIFARSAAQNPRGKSGNA